MIFSWSSFDLLGQQRAVAKLSTSLPGRLLWITERIYLTNQNLLSHLCAAPGARAARPQIHHQPSPVAIKTIHYIGFQMG